MLLQNYEILIIHLKVLMTNQILIINFIFFVLVITKSNETYLENITKN